MPDFGRPVASYIATVDPLLVGSAPPRADALFRIRQLWIYTALIVVVVGGLVSALAQEWRLFVPIGCLSVLVGLVGTAMTLLQDRLKSSEGNKAKEDVWWAAPAGEAARYSQPTKGLRERDSDNDN